MSKRNFTLIELLVVVGIIALLAGLLTPAVIGAQQQGRITQAKSDMAAILMAIKGMDNSYGKMMVKDSTNYKLGNVSFEASDGAVTVGKLSSKEYDSDEIDNYCKVIAELSDPGNTGVTPSLNKRKIKFLDPKPEYDPSSSCTSAGNKKNTWLDPWGNPYFIRINVDYSEQIPDPSSSGKVAGKAIMWSLGPDGQGSDTAGASENKDNVCSWKDSWK